jgi:hypothetical protein
VESIIDRLDQAEEKFKILLTSSRKYYIQKALKKEKASMTTTFKKPGI